MSDFVKELRKLTDLDVYVTSNVKVIRTMGSWRDPGKRYQFIPATRLGFVVVIESSKGIECEPLKGYALYLPCSLTLHFIVERIVTMRDISISGAASWRFSSRKKWRDIAIMQECVNTHCKVSEC